MSPIRIVALSGGVGGAKMAHGLLQALPPQALTVIVNTSDDFEHLGLHISPDLDTVLYTLSGLANPKTGWGRHDETWSCLSALDEWGENTWFKLGDADLALHLIRTQRLRQGNNLTRITEDLALKRAIHARILPMSDSPVRTLVDSDIGLLEFQDYFVRHQCQPRITALRFLGIDLAAPTEQIQTALRSPDLGAIIICPSNPYLSIDPILAVPGMRALLQHNTAPIIAISPLVGGNAVKGPTAKIMTELGVPVSAHAIAQHYEDLIDGFVLDVRDHLVAESIHQPTLITDTLMKTPDDRLRLARATLSFATSLSHQKRKRTA